jgi:hypothetical protein
MWVITTHHARHNGAPCTGNTPTASGLAGADHGVRRVPVKQNARAPVRVRAAVPAAQRSLRVAFAAVAAHGERHARRRRIGLGAAALAGRLGGERHGNGGAALATIQV